MNEGFRLHLQVDGAPLAVNTLNSDGLMLSNETSAPPRGFTLNVIPGNSIMEYRLQRVRQIEDWEFPKFLLNISVDDGAILCRGVDANALPSGSYEVQAMIADLNAVDQPLDVEIPDNGIADVTLKFVTDPRRIELTTPVDQFDPKILRVIQDAGSGLDGETIAQWLDDANPRPRRKACLLNLLAKLRAARAPRPKSQLIDDVTNIFFGDVDRVYATVTSAMLADLKTLSDDPNKPFYFEGSPKAPIHQSLLAQVARLETDAAQFTLNSFRQEGKPSMQAVVAVPPGGDPSRRHYADLDIDLGNPLQDVEGFVIHMGELLSDSKTDHLALAAKLSKGATSDFMYYRVVQVKAAGG